MKLRNMVLRILDGVTDGDKSFCIFVRDSWIGYTR